MINFTVKMLICFLFSSFISFSNATPITNLTQVELDVRDYTNAEDKLIDSLLGVNFINYKGYDWAWVSPVNIENFPDGNILYAPELHKNWRFADLTLLNILKTELTLDDFKAGNGDIIHAAQFFNSEFVSVDEDNFLSGSVSSEWVGASANFFLQRYETFYVRPSTSGASTPVPEPSTLLIFSLGLIALVSKKRLSS